MTLNSNIFTKDYFERGKRLGLSPYENYRWDVVKAHFIAWDLSLLKTFRPERALDIGCAKGFLVRVLHWYGVDTYGVDISSYAVNNAPAEVRPYLRIVDISTDELPFPDSYFDLITMFEVVEHVKPERCEEVFEKVAEKLQHGGFFVITTPSPSSPEAKLDRTYVNINRKWGWISQITVKGFERSRKHEAALLFNLIPLYSINVAKYPSGLIYRKVLRHLNPVGKLIVLFYTLFNQLRYEFVEHITLVFRKR